MLNSQIGNIRYYSGRISDIRPVHNGLNNMEIALVNNTPCAVAKGIFTVNEVIFFIPVDTFVIEEPTNPVELDFTPNPVYKDIFSYKRCRGVHVKPVMVAGNLSAGLITKLNKRPQPEQLYPWTPENRPGILGGRPPFVPSSTFTEVSIDAVKDHPQTRGQMIQVTRKIESMASPVTVYYLAKGSAWFKALENRLAGDASEQPNGRVGVCNQTRDYKDDGTKNLSKNLWKSIRDINLPATLSTLDITKDLNLAFEGVIVTQWAGVPGRSLAKRRFVVHSIWNVDGQTRSTPVETWNICRTLSLEHVPLVGYCHADNFAGKANLILDGPVQIICKTDQGASGLVVSIPARTS